MEWNNKHMWPTAWSIALREASSRSAARAIHQFYIYGSPKPRRQVSASVPNLENLKWNGARGGAFRWGSALQAKRSQIRFPMKWLNSFSPHYGPGVDLASDRNEWVPGTSPGTKVAGA